jgi:hypothetical protein
MTPYFYDADDVLTICFYGIVSGTVFWLYFTTSPE